MLGETLSHYEIVEKIGEGGMGEVYRAHDTKLGREVAIKLLPAEFSQDKDRLLRFEREAKLLAALNHPCIATLYGFEESEGTPFLVMELVEGETLAERIARGVIPMDEALPLFRQIAEAVENAHEKGVIHQDLKPPNIKITPDGVLGVAATFGKRVIRQPDVETGAELRPDGAQMTGPAHEHNRPSADTVPFSFCRSPSPPCTDYARDIMPTTRLCRVGWSALH